METLVNPPEMDTGMRKAMDTENQGVTLRHMSAGHCYIKETVWAVNYSKLKNFQEEEKKIQELEKKERTRAMNFMKYDGNCNTRFNLMVSLIFVCSIFYIVWRMI